MRSRERARHLRVRGVDRARDDDDVGAVDVLGAVADQHARAELLAAARSTRPASGRSPARRSRGSAAPRRCRSCRCRRCRRSGSCGCGACGPSCRLPRRLHAGVGEPLVRVGDGRSRARPGHAQRAAGGRPRAARAAAPRATSASGRLRAAASRRRRRTTNCALRVWWSSTAAGNGTRTAGTPAAASSATVSAPERHTTRSAQP